MVIAAGVKWVLIWFLSTEPGVVVDSGSATFKNERACESAAAAAAERAWPAHLEWTCEPDYIRAPAS